MILKKSIHTVHFGLLFIKFIVLGSEGFEEVCALVCTKGDHFSLSIKMPAKAGRRVKRYMRAAR